MPIRIVILNNSKTVIGFPLEYVNRVGPHIKILDTATQKERRLRVNLAPLDLLTKFTFIPPQGSVEMDEVITANEIKSFRDKFIDLDIEVVIAAQIQFENSPPTKYRGVNNFKILGKDTAELRASSTSSLRR